MRRAFLAMVLLLPVIAAAAFSPTTPAKNVTAINTSVRVPIPATGTQLWITVTGPAEGAYISLGNSSVTASRDTATVTYQNMFVPAGAIGVVIQRNSLTHFAVISATAGDTTRVQFMSGGGEP